MKVREPLGITASSFYKEIIFMWLMINTYKSSWYIRIDQKTEKIGTWNLVKECYKIHRL